MKILSDRTRVTYRAVLRHLKARGLRLDAMAMTVAADIALCVEEGNLEEAERQARKIGFDLSEVGDR